MCLWVTEGTASLHEVLAVFTPPVTVRGSGALRKEKLEVVTVQEGQVGCKRRRGWNICLDSIAKLRDI